MFLLKNYIKSLIIAWLASLAMYMAKRIFSQAFKHYGTPSDSSRPTAQDMNIVDTLWVGMPEQQLRSIYGAPDQRYSGTRDHHETWVYNPFRHNRNPLTVTLEHKKVTGWSFDTTERPVLT